MSDPTPTIRQPAEERHAAELAALRHKDPHPRPPGWLLSPKRVEVFLLGSGKATFPTPDGPKITIRPKYLGDRRLIQVAIATLASERALLLVGEPGTAKSWRAGSPGPRAGHPHLWLYTGETRRAHRTRAQRRGAAIMRPLPEEEVKALCQEADYRNGQDYYQKGKVSDTWQSENSLHAQVAGSGSKPYQVSILEEGGKLRPRCTCPAHRRHPYCKHVAAVLVAYARAPERFVAGEVQATPEVPRPRRAAQPKVDRRQVQAEGLSRVEELLVELTSYGLLSLNEALLARVQDQVQAAESHKLRRLARLLGQIDGALTVALRQRERFGEAAYAELLSDAWLTVQATRRALEDPQANPAALEDLVGKTWREGELERREGVRLLELGYETTRLATGFIVDTSYLWSLDEGALYAEKQIVPATLKGQSRKHSYAGRLTGTIGLYPGQEPRRVKLLAMDPETPPGNADWERALAHADRAAEAVVQRFQAVTANPLAVPEAYTLFAPTRILIDGPAVYLLDGGDQALPLAEGWRILSYLTRQPMGAVFGRAIAAEGELRLVPLGLITALPEARLVRCTG